MTSLFNFKIRKELAELPFFTNYTEVGAGEVQNIVFVKLITLFNTLSATEGRVTYERIDVSLFVSEEYSYAPNCRRRVKLGILGKPPQVHVIIIRELT